MTLSYDTVILASSSAVRLQMLQNAGLSIEVDPANIDEMALKASFAKEGFNIQEVAEALATLKAERISQRYPNHLVIGADQMLECEGKWFDKAKDSEEAKNTLKSLSGRGHKLYSSVVVARQGARLWHYNAHARLKMRPLSHDFISAYLDEMGDKAIETVGVYQLEGLGAQLFTQVEGDFFTILGLPLLPLLDFLRTHHILKT
jgi:septum formation protein